MNELSRPTASYSIRRAIRVWVALLIVIPAFVAHPRTVEATGAPTVSSVLPETGPTLGGTTITITGTNFVSGGTTVAFGSFAATNVTFVSSTSITVVTPVSTAGIVNVAVTTSNGQSTSNTGSQFEYVAPSAYTALSVPTLICDNGLAGEPGLWHLRGHLRLPSTPSSR